MMKRLALLCVFCASSAAVAQEAPPEGSGSDIVSLDRRFDLRAEVASDNGEDEQTLTLRYDRRFKVNNTWIANLRFDLPFKRTDQDNGTIDFGRGDFLFQATFGRKFSNGEGLSFGSQIILPTGVQQQEGRGKWRMRPIVAYRWPAPTVTPDSFFQLLVRYDGSFAGGEDRRDTREIQVSPNLEIALPGKTYVSIFPSADIRYDFVNDELFVPVDLEVGKEWGRIVASVEGAAGIVKDDHRPYDWKVETRLGYRF